MRFKNREVSIIPNANNTRFEKYIFTDKLNSIQFNLTPQRHKVNTYYNLDVNNINLRVVTVTWQFFNSVISKCNSVKDI
jgi:hypothetical protein